MTMRAAVARRADPVALSVAAALGLLALVALAAPGAIGPALALLALAALAIATYARPGAALVLWLALVTTSPEFWLGNLLHAHETVIALLKAAEFAIIGLAALRLGPRLDRFNPTFAFGAIFTAGLFHGLWPSLTLLASVRSLFGATAPFATGFMRMDRRLRRAIIRTVIAGPLLSVLLGLVLMAAGLRGMVNFEQGAARLYASSSPAFLGGFCVIAVYAGTAELLATGARRELAWLALNFAILIATGARAPLVLGAAVFGLSLLTIPAPLISLRLRLAIVLAGFALLGLALMAASALTSIRVIDLIRLGEAGDLSNRTLIWPYFLDAIARSPWLGWGLGAGKVVVPLHSHIGRLLGTNAAHDEYLRITTDGGVLGATLLFAMLGLWLWDGSRHLALAHRRVVRLAFLAFAIQSATDNTLIATTSLAFFTWARAVFAVEPDADEPTEENASHDTGRAITSKSRLPHGIAPPG